MPVRSQTPSPKLRLRPPSEAATPAEARARLNEWIAEGGLKATRQRDLIVDTFFSSTGHLSVAEFLSKAQDPDQKLGAATAARSFSERGGAGRRPWDPQPSIGGGTPGPPPGPRAPAISRTGRPAM